MRRRNLIARKTIVALLLPIFAATFFSIAYGAWIDYVALNFNLVASRAPEIKVTSATLNLNDGLVRLTVDNATTIIQGIYPNPLLILLNITNTGPAPITKLIVNNTAPQEWSIAQPPVIEYVRQDGNIATINPYGFTVQSDGTTGTLSISLADMEAAVGRYLNQNETVLITLSMTYSLIGTQLPPEYSNATVVYTNTATATAYITSWQSQPASATSIFTTYIYWV